MTDKPEGTQIRAEPPPEGRRHHSPDPHHDGRHYQSLADAEQGHGHRDDSAAGCLGYDGKCQRPQAHRDGNDDAVAESRPYFTVQVRFDIEAGA